MPEFYQQEYRAAGYVHAGCKTLRFILRISKSRDFVYLKQIEVGNILNFPRQAQCFQVPEEVDFFSDRADGTLLSKNCE